MTFSLTGYIADLAIVNVPPKLCKLVLERRHCRRLPSRMLEVMFEPHVLVIQNEEQLVMLFEFVYGLFGRGALP